MTDPRALDNGRAAVATVRALLNSIEEFPPVREDDRGEVVNFHFTVEGPTPHVHAQVFVPTERFAVYFTYPEPVAPERRAMVAVFTVMANDETLIGGYQFTPSTGRLRFKCSMDFTGTPLAEVLVRNALLDAMDTIELFDDALSAVLDDELAPDMAVAAALRAEQE